MNSLRRKSLDQRTPSAWKIRKIAGKTRGKARKLIEKLRRRIEEEVRTFKALEVAPEVVQEAQETLEDVEEVETKEEVALQSKSTGSGKKPR